MACMEHWCRKCNHMEFNNGNMFVCPKCGSTDISSTWDEQHDYDYDDYDDEDYEEEDEE